MRELRETRDMLIVKQELYLHYKWITGMVSEKNW